MQLTLLSNPSNGGATIGDLSVDEVWTCHTLEDEVREIPGEPVANWKIYGRTAIPAGRYRVTLEYSGKFGADTMSVNDVPGYTYVRIHPGNTAADTDGCIILGMRATDVSIVAGTSKPAVDHVKSLVRAAIERGEEAWLTVTRSWALA